jgi:recombination protein RecA
LAQRVTPGRLVELSGAGAVARTTTAVSILRAAQRQGETAAWIQPAARAVGAMKAAASLFPPDLVESGIDLDALVVIHVPPTAGPHGLLRAAELLLRSSGFGLVIIDLDLERPKGPPAAWQGRLLGLARQHESRVIFLTRNVDENASLGPLIGLRVQPRVRRVRREDLPSGTSALAKFEVDCRLLKNKSGAPFAIQPERCRGPWGMR